MSDYLRIDLLSDTTFSRGDGTAGEVDVEIAHDDAGLPTIPGRTLIGLLRDAWLAMAPYFGEDAPCAAQILGREGSVDFGDAVRFWIGTAELDVGTREWVRYAVGRADNPIPSAQILRACTDIRRQTARDRARGGAPERTTLRSTRVALRGLSLSAPIECRGFDEGHWRTLARMCLGVRHAGLRRNRGGGSVQLSLYQNGADVTADAAALEA